MGNRGVPRPLFMWLRLAPPGRVFTTSKDGTEGKKLYLVLTGCRAEYVVVFVVVSATTDAYVRPEVVSFDYHRHHTWLFPAKDQRPWKFLLQEMLEQNSQGETLD